MAEKAQLSKADQLVSEIENAHKKELFRLFDAIRFDLNLTFGGKERFNGRITAMTDGSEIKIEDAWFKILGR